MPIRDNKFARQAQDRKKNSNLGREEQLTVDQQLARLEDSIRRLKIEFDIFFNGASKRPPYDTKNRVEAMIKRLADDRTLTFAQRFQYNSLAARYVAFRDMWRRTLQGREEGRDPVTAARVSARAAVAEDVPPASSDCIFVCADARADVRTVKQLYDALIEAKRSCGEPTESFSFSSFHRQIAAKTDNLKERLGCERVCFSVRVEGGRVNFKAKADKE